MQYQWVISRRSHSNHMAQYRHVRFDDDMTNSKLGINGFRPQPTCALISQEGLMCIFKSYYLTFSVLKFYKKFKTLLFQAGEIRNKISTMCQMWRRSMVTDEHVYLVMYTPLFSHVTRVYMFMPYASNKGADQPARMRSLVSTFVVRYLDS